MQLPGFPRATFRGCLQALLSPITILLEYKLLFVLPRLLGIAEAPCRSRHL